MKERYHHVRWKQCECGHQHHWELYEHFGGCPKKLRKKEQGNKKQ